MKHDVESVDYLEISEEKSATFMGEKLGHQNPLEKSKLPLRSPRDTAPLGEYSQPELSHGTRQGEVTRRDSCIHERVRGLMAANDVDEVRFLTRTGRWGRGIGDDIAYSMIDR